MILGEKHVQPMQLQGAILSRKRLHSWYLITIKRDQA